MIVSIFQVIDSLKDPHFQFTQQSSRERELNRASD